MRNISTAAQAALDAETIAPRDFISIFAKRRDNGAIVEDCYWSDEGTVNAEIIDPLTGLTITRTFKGGGGLLQISAVPIVVGIIVQNVTIQMSQVDDRIQQLFRGYDPRQARVELHRGMIDPATARLVAPAVPRFSGFVNEVDITTPKEGEDGSVSVICTSHTQEMTRSNPATRSDADQRLRSSSDGFFRHVTTIGEQNIFWGSESA